MTELRYLPDADDVYSFSATVEEATEDYLVLDGTYFYPEGGGQPADHGRIEWEDGHAEIVDANKNHGDVRHHIGSLSGELPVEGETVEGQIDEERRQKHRRMHTAQHIVSRVVLDEYGATTAGNQIHADRSRIDFEPADFDDEDITFIENESNAIIDRNLSVIKEQRPRDRVEAEVDEGRALLDLIPDHVDPLRVVEIDGYDMCPCGGTHVDQLSEIGHIDIINRESKGKDTVRIEFELQAT
ncbi:MAG: alanyl-tRNA editing protein [Halobacteriales archaeon]